MQKGQQPAAQQTIGMMSRRQPLKKGTRKNKKHKQEDEPVEKDSPNLAKGDSLEKESGKASLEKESGKASLEKEAKKVSCKEEGATSAPSRPSKPLAKGQEAPALAKEGDEEQSLAKGAGQAQSLEKGVVMHQQPLAKGKKSQPLEKGLCQSRQHHHLHLAKGGR